MTKITYTVPEVPGSKRTSERPYTHAVIGRRDGRCSAIGIEATLATEEPKNRRWDGKSWDDSKREAEATAGQLYRNHNGYMVEASQFLVDLGTKFIAENPDRTAFIEKKAAERAAYLAKLKASEPGPLVVLQWSMSIKNAYRAIGTMSNHHSAVRVVECLPVEKKEKISS